jgi:hypothetical protein
MKLFFLGIALFTFIACGSGNNNVDNLLTDNQISPADNKKTKIFLVSENDCSSCTGYLISKIIRNIKGQKGDAALGLFFGNSNSPNFETLKNITPTDFEWKPAKNNTIYIWAANQTGSKYGPYLIELNKGKFDKITALK